MSDPCGGQSWAGPEPSAVEAALAASYTVAVDRAVATRTVWLDSIDLRLYRSGIALTAVEDGEGGDCMLQLSRTDGATVTAGPDTLSRPRVPERLPDDLRPHLEPVLGVRALLPIVEAAGTSDTGRLLDVEGKTVVRLVHQRPATLSGGRGLLSGGLWLIALRGYDTAGDCAARIAHRAGLWVTPQLKLLGDLTTPSRDLDVLLQELPVPDGWSDEPPARGRGTAGAAPQRASCGRTAQARGRPAVAAVRAVPGTMARLAAALATWDGQPGAGPTAAEVVVERLDRAHRRVLRRGSRITDRSPAEDLHDLRKRAKELRYLLETFPRRRIRPTLASPSRS